ncbi:unnamed protein product [Toxocara canis]|uniref:SH3 domain-containing protein n=1 Tax=Toxocara canis TaxID=6265 RepID=A0A183UM08_TOXCA|nr:unnamed protein product [Toxocara canis]
MAITLTALAGAVRCSLASVTISNSAHLAALSEVAIAVVVFDVAVVMVSLFNRLLSIDEVQKRVIQFKDEVDKLLLQEELARLNSYDMHNLQRRCADLKKQIDGYIHKIEGMKVGAKNAGEVEVRDGLMQQLDDLSDDLAMLINPNHVRKKPRAVEELLEQETEHCSRESEQGDTFVERDVAEPSKRELLKEDTFQGYSVEEDGTDFGDLNDNREKKEQRISAESPSPEGILISENLFRVIADFQAEQQSDLSVRTGETVIIHATREDGWWMAERSDGKRGLIPKTFLKVHPKSPAVLHERVSVEVHRPATTSSSQPLSIEEQEEISARKGAEVGSHNAENVRKAQHEAASMKSVPLMATMAEQENMRTVPAKVVKQVLIFILPDFFLNHVANFEAMAITGGLQRQQVSETCLGAALSNDVHLSYRCHLTPRLSESNVGFHDLYWNYEANKVSNVHTIKAQARAHGERTWTFIAKTDGEHTSVEFSDFFVRSNYIQVDVVILIEASVVHCDADGKISETPMGYASLPIIGESGHCCLQNSCVKRPYRHIGIVLSTRSGLTRNTTHMKISFRVSDVNETIVSFVDSLPDILVWNPMFARLGFYYRRSLGEVLLKQRSNPMNGELIPDPFLATFPIIVDQVDVMDLLRSLWMNKLKSYGNKKREELEENALFRELYMNTAFVLCGTVPMPQYDMLNVNGLAERAAILKAFREQYVASNNPLKYLVTQRSKPLDIFAYAVDLVGEHAID